VVIEVFCVRTRGVQEREVKEYVVDIPELGTTDFLLFERARTHEACFELFETEVVQVVLRHKWASFGWTVHVLLLYMYIGFVVISTC
jgi:hypothetical protein